MHPLQDYSNGDYHYRNVRLCCNSRPDQFQILCIQFKALVNNVWSIHLIAKVEVLPCQYGIITEELLPCWHVVQIIGVAKWYPPVHLQA